MARSSILRNLGLLVWKSLLLRRRQWIVTVLEILLPFLLLLYMLTSTGGRIDNYRPPITLQEHGTILSDLKWENCKDGITNPKESAAFLAYTSKGPNTDNVMTKLAAFICKNSSQSLGFVPVASQVDLESKYESDWHSKDNFKAAIIFNGDGDLSSQDKVSYTIRMPAKCLPSTNDLYPKPGHFYYREIGPNWDMIHMYSRTQKCQTSYLALQWNLDAVLARWAQYNKDPKLDLEKPGPLDGMKAILQPFPYPEYTLPEHNIFRLVNLYVLMAWCGLFMLPTITRNALAEKRSGMGELLHLTGVPIYLQWLGWILHVIVPQLLIIFLAPLLLTVTGGSCGTPYLKHANMLLLLVIFILYFLAVCASGFFNCSVFRKPIAVTLIGVLGALISMAVGLVYFLMAGSLGMPPWVILIPSIFSPNFCVAAILVNIWYLESTVRDDTSMPIGATWATLSENHLKMTDANFTIVWVDVLSNLALLLCLVFQFVVYLLVAVYLDGVLPSEFGVQRPWYFFRFSKGQQRNSTVSPGPPTDNNAQVSSELSLPEVEALPAPEQSESRTTSTASRKKSVSRKSRVSTASKSTVVISPFEKEPIGAEVGVEVVNLVKKFGPDKVAVNGVSLKMFSGDIFALLGHNGAGKTTTISMLTGFFAPTSGTAFIQGHDITTELDKAQDTVGLCPQHNTLFEMLGCAEQLRFFGMLRGLKWKEAKAQADILLERVNLKEKAKVTAGKLSGGQKRKLSLGIALIGGTKVVVLDEPTSGMDPQARREMWDLLLQLRGDRTILLTTHFMEEADVLGDRIGIMAAGKLQCCGTASFLKKYYSLGHTLKLTLVGNAQPSKSAPQQSDHSLHESTTETVSLQAKESDVDSTATAILNVVRKHVPNANFKTDSKMDKKEVSIMLPSEEATTQILQQLFATLTSQKDKLSINTIGLAPTSMDEVFMRVGEISEADASTAHATWEGIDEAITKSPTTSGSKFVGQFLSLLMKKLVYTRCRWTSLLFSILLLTFLVLVAGVWNVILVKTSASGTSSTARSGAGGQGKAVKTHLSLSLTFEKYRNSKTFYVGPEDLKKVLGGSSALRAEKGNLTTSLLKVAKDDLAAFKNNYVVAIERKEDTYRALYNLHPYHAAPLVINLITNYLLLTSKSPLSFTRIEASNHPLNGESLDMTKRPRTDEEDFREVPECQRGGGPPGRRGGGGSGPKGGGGPGPGSGSGPRSRSVREAKNDPEGGTPPRDYYYYPDCHKNRGVENEGDWTPWLVAGTIPVGMVLFLIYFVAQPTEENVCKVKQLQMMTGVSPFIYWGAAFTADFLFFATLIFCLLLLFVFFPDLAISEYNVLTANGGWIVSLVICLAYGATTILLCYVVSLRARSVVGGYTLLLLLSLVGAICGMFIPDPQHPIYNSAMGPTMLTFHIMNRFNPSYSMARAIWYWGQVSAANAECPLMAVNPDKCPEALPYLVWSTERIRRIGTREGGGPVDVDLNAGRKPCPEAKARAGGPGGESSGPEEPLVTWVTETTVVPGIAQELVFIASWGLFYLVLLFCCEYKLWRKLKKRLKKRAKREYSFLPDTNDDDVRNEAARVDELIGENQLDSEALVVHHLFKSFGTFAAVSNLQFGVHHGECFGLRSERGGEDHSLSNDHWR